jgi:hypothetical protein
MKYSTDWLKDQVKNGIEVKYYFCSVMNLPNPLNLFLSPLLLMACLYN